MMNRTQISLEAEIHKQAKERAAGMGLSLAGYIRKLLRNDLEIAEEPRARVEDLFNLGSSGRSDISSDTDKAVADAIEAETDRRSEG